MPIKLREKITLGQSKKLQNFFDEGMEKHFDEIIKIIAVNEDGSDINNVDDLAEEDLLNVCSEYILKKNSMMKNFMEKIKS